MLAQKIDDAIASQDNTPPRPNLAGPFPNLRCREVVKDIVDRLVDVTTHCKYTALEANAFALGLVQGARIVATKDECTTLESFVVELLSKLNRGGVDAVKELVEIVTGHELELTVAEAA